MVTNCLDIQYTDHRFTTITFGGIPSHGGSPWPSSMWLAFSQHQTLRISPHLTNSGIQAIQVSTEHNRLRKIHWFQHWPFPYWHCELWKNRQVFSRYINIINNYIHWIRVTAMENRVTPGHPVRVGYPVEDGKKKVTFSWIYQWIRNLWQIWLP